MASALSLNQGVWSSGRTFPQGIWLCPEAKNFGLDKIRFQDSHQVASYKTIGPGSCKHLDLRAATAKRAQINLDLNHLQFVAFSSIKAVGQAK